MGKRGNPQAAKQDAGNQNSGDQPVLKIIAPYRAGIDYFDDEHGQ
jgi:hypothetical protein